MGYCFQLRTRKDAEAANRAIRGNRYKLVCLNDQVEEPDDFIAIASTVNGALESILGEKSSFEK